MLVLSHMGLLFVLFQLYISHGALQEGNKDFLSMMSLLRTRTQLWRQKREEPHVPQLTVPENMKGIFPKKLLQAGLPGVSDRNVSYSITGKCADASPTGAFFVHKDAGTLYVTRALDREEIASYTILIHAVSPDGQPVREPVELKIKVADQNDNKPQFTKQIFEGSVMEGARSGTYVMSVVATDADDPTTKNAIIGYSIVSQEPILPSENMFTIDKLTGVITVNKTIGPVREGVLNYTVTVQAADMEGTGLSTTATAVINVKSGSPSELSSGLIIHAQDITSEAPANNLIVSVYSMMHPANKQEWHLITKGVAGSHSLLTPDQFTKGIYKVRFETWDYWRQQDKISIYPYVEVIFAASAPSQTCHVSLQLGPYSYTASSSGDCFKEEEPGKWQDLLGCK